MPKKHKAPWGFNGYGAWNRRHAVRSALCLPVPPGEFRHPDFAREKSGSDSVLYNSEIQNFAARIYANVT